MKEYITVSGKEYPCLDVITTTDSISALMENQKIEDVIKTFKPATSLTVAGESKEIYGAFEDLSFKSATVNEDGTILVTMAIASDTDKRLAELEKTQIKTLIDFIKGEGYKLISIERRPEEPLVDGDAVLRLNIDQGRKFNHRVIVQDVMDMEGVHYVEELG